MDVYDDIDLFNLQGLKQIKNPTKYPYIKIESLNNQRKIIYKRSAKDSVERIYNKKNGYWTTTFELKADTGYIAVYEYIISKKIIELEYYGTYKKTDYHLHDAALIEKDKIITYSFWGDKGIDITPHPNNFEVVKKKGKAIFTDRIDKNNDALRIRSSSFDKIKNEIFYSDTSCYKINDHSWFWWRYFALEKSIKCE
jgi:hypothetical protein